MKNEPLCVGNMRYGVRASKEMSLEKSSRGVTNVDG